MKDLRPGEHQFLRKLKMKARPLFANVGEYSKQLLLGGDPAIDAAVGGLKRLVENEGLMMGAVVLRKTTRIESVVAHIQGLNVEICDAVYELQADSTGVKIQVTQIQQSLDRIEAGQVETKYNTSATKLIATAIRNAQSEQATKSDIDALRSLLIAERESQPSGPNKQTSALAPTKTSLSKEMKQGMKLEASLAVKDAKKANNDVFERVRADRMEDTGFWIMQEELVKQWIEGDFPFLVVSGESGYGKTFLASRIVDELLGQYKQGTQNVGKSVAYFFCRKGQPALESVSLVLRTLAIGIASNDKVYAKYLSDLFDSKKLVTSDDDGNFTVASQKEVEVVESRPVVKTDGDEDFPGAAGQPKSSGGFAGATEMCTSQEVSSDEGTVALALQESQSTADQTHQIDSARPDDEAAVRELGALWELLFVKYFKNRTSSAYLIIDAIDECEQSDAMALWAAFRALTTADNAPHGLSLLAFVTSDKTTQLLPALGATAPHIQFDGQHNSKDLKRFVQHRMTAAWSTQLVRKALYDEVLHVIVEACNGNFLKASLIVDEVTSLSREDVIAKTIASLPKDLKAAMLLVINRLSRQLDKSSLEDLHDILAWVVCASRDLNLAELDALMYIREPFGARVINLEARMHKEFASLFSVTGKNTISDTAVEERLHCRLPEVDELLLSAAVLEQGSKRLGGSNAEQGHIGVNGLDRRRTAAMQERYVALAHSLIAEQIQEQKAQEGITNFTRNSMQTTVLLSCLDALCDTKAPHDEDSVKLACNYCGANLPYHLKAVHADEVVSDMRVKIAKRIVQLLRDESCIDRWVPCAGPDMARDLLQSREFREMVTDWLQDPNVQQHLDIHDKEWIATIPEAPIKTLYGALALGHSRHWLTRVTNPADSFKFLNVFQTAVTTTGVESADDDKDYALEAASKHDIISLAESAGFEQDSLWHGRVGAALGVAKLYEESAAYLVKALELDKLDDEDGVIRAELAYIYADQERWVDAARELSLAIGSVKQGLQSARPSPYPDCSLPRCLLLNRLALASHYSQAQNVVTAMQTYEEAIEDWETSSESSEYWDDLVSAVTASFETMCNANEWHRAAELLERMVSHPKRLSQKFLSVYSYFMGNDLLHIGYEANCVGALERLADNALITVARYGFDGQTAFVRYNRAVSMLRLQPGSQGEAISLMEAIIDDEEVLDASNGYYCLKDMAERELARVYLDRTLRAREMDLWPDVGCYADKLVRLVKAETDAEGEVVFGTRGCAPILAAWDRVNGRSDRARDCVRCMVDMGIEMLSDTNPENDYEAWVYLGDALLAVGDMEGAIAAVNMLRQSFLGQSPVKDGGAADFDRQLEQNGSGEEDTRAGARESRPLSAEMVAEGDAKSVNETPMLSEHSGATQASDTAVSGTVSATTSGDTDAKASSAEVMALVEQLVPILDAKATNAEQANPNGAFYSCDGSCFEDIPDSAAMYRCSYCIADFCVGCHELIKQGRMEKWSICGSSHDHVPIPAIGSKYPAGVIEVAGEGVQIRDWVNTLKEEWSCGKQ
ncbi:hypothetical protein LTR36_004744 [Oleoguttula mirabilis]|uniref:Nephrocystin 3-like N-terminal domain-containing protein n=1 Tax=Oleoguttula mirabilis TaxID=1507867 RepID=A0AAV9JG21_9PEZI|nr:hypothetical protein LTR36_004744 [Oleoguttula mirabilis]